MKTTLAKWRPTFTDSAELLAYADVLEDCPNPDFYAANLYRALGRVKVAAPGLNLAPTVRSLLAPFLRTDRPSYQSRFVRAINNSHPTLLTNGAVMFQCTDREKRSWQTRFLATAIMAATYDPLWVARVWPDSSGALLSSNGMRGESDTIHYLPLRSVDPSAPPYHLNAIYTAFLLHRYPTVRFYAPSARNDTVVAPAPGIVAVVSTCNPR